jgi:hypothetical protein
MYRVQRTLPQRGSDDLKSSSCAAESVFWLTEEAFYYWQQFICEAEPNIFVQVTPSIICERLWRTVVTPPQGFGIKLGGGGFDISDKSSALDEFAFVPSAKIEVGTGFQELHGGKVKGHGNAETSKCLPKSLRMLLAVNLV